ncbi:DEAD/DEAH box helicase [Thermosynechococcus sichuanensis E542]|uniref:DEAD/DEAH box helicase n=1 Tax=Thermosynechococcus sichuanensis E542 TaxID=2016101 RepID=A0A7D6IQN2_9CYAN|nr:DEAD/DEAH box helicase [Thermosynechococcus vestitus]QLL29433.1 DEAD/DEAH box helicase [Thermosynechococcus vestitus E542]
MAVLHGTWLATPTPQFFLWAEEWRSLAQATTPWASTMVPVYPYAAPLKLSLAKASPSFTYAALPAQVQGNDLVPSPLAEANGEPLFLWQVPGWSIPASAVLEQLHQLSLHGQDSGGIGDDLRYWFHVSRWLLDLIVRGQYLPTAEGWRILLTHRGDRDRFRQFSQLMPHLCRCYQEEATALRFPPHATDLLADFLHHTLQGYLHTALAALDLPKVGLGKEHSHWLTFLKTGQGTELPPSFVERLQRWQEPYREQLDLRPQWRLALQLVPPETAEGDWRLAFGLQTEGETETMLAAAEIWQCTQESLLYQGQVLWQPQETLLRGLGLASRIYRPLDRALQEPSPVDLTLQTTEVYAFLQSAIPPLEQQGVAIILPPSLRRNSSQHRLGLKMIATLPPTATSGLSIESLMQFRWQLQLGQHPLSEADFDQLRRQETPLVYLNGEWVLLRPQEVKAAQEFLQSPQKIQLSLADTLRIATGDTVTVAKLPILGLDANDALQALLDGLTGKQTLDPVPTPQEFCGELRPYQARGVAWLSFLERWRLGACLADDMGLGKTIQLLAFLLHLKEAGRAYRPTLLICPTSVLGNWLRECQKFAPTLRAYVHHGSDRPKGKAFLKKVETHDLILTSYALLQRDRATLQQVSWQHLVLDEAQNIKNANTQQSQAARDLAAQFRIALTGTPLENRLLELWSIMEFLHPGYLGNRTYFQHRYVRPIERYGDTTSLNALRTYVQPFILRRLKTDRSIIQDLPEKQEMLVYCGLTLEQMQLYSAVVEESLTAIENSEGIQRRGNILATLTKLKQICNHPAQYLKQEDYAPDRSGKLQRLIEMLQELQEVGDRALVFTQFAEFGTHLKTYLEQALQQEVFFLSGRTPKAQRELMVERFQHDPEAPTVFILSLKAGGVGLNLTRANHVFHYDRWWNPAVENQASDRAFRIGQARNVQIHKFVCTGTLEEKIHEQIEQKKALAEMIVGSGEHWLTELNLDQLRQLLTLDKERVMTL